MLFTSEPGIFAELDFDFVHSIGGCFGFRLLHQVDRASFYFRSISRCMLRIALLRARLVRGSADRIVVLPQSSVDPRPQPTTRRPGKRRVRGLDRRWSVIVAEAARRSWLRWRRGY